MAYKCGLCGQELSRADGMGGAIAHLRRDHDDAPARALAAFIEGVAERIAHEGSIARGER